MKVYKVRSGDPQVAISCLGGCGLMIAWVLVGVANVSLYRFFNMPAWAATVVFLVWLLSFPVGTVVYLKWRGRRHSRAFKILEAEFTEKTQERLRKPPPEA